MTIYILVISFHLHIRSFYRICRFWFLRIHLMNDDWRFNTCNITILFSLLSSLLLLSPPYTCLILYHVYYLVRTYLFHSLHRIKSSSSLLHAFVELSCKKLHFNWVLLQSISLVLVALHELLKRFHLHALILLFFFHLQKPWPYNVVHYPEPKYLWRWLALLLSRLEDLILGFEHTIELTKIIN